MKIVVAGISGNLGKSTLSAHMLVPRMENAKLLIVESINQDTQDLVGESQKIRGEEFKKIYMQLVLYENLVVDVGASNAEAFFEGLSSFSQGYDEVDFFVIPVVPGVKEQADSITTARMLSAMGVEKDKIRIVFNRVKRSVEEEFPEILDAANNFDCFIANTKCAVYENDIYEDLADLRMPLADACTLARNKLEELKQCLRVAAYDPIEFAYAMKKLNVAKKAINTCTHLDEAFESLFEEAGNAGLQR
ncbi:StbB family protein [Pseudomonas sp. MIL19]|uniref:StbB family protein n=1 Tax=Pseudomonas sp. MIL19 TaxID=2976979 RepID=UPI0023639D12|nr:StbB family protein [Pseudomonas sp. MIL19]MDD2162534.1 StbB family protein [Pseudomonas sp. MIL19]